jgi:hypothetical protein
MEKQVISRRLIKSPLTLLVVVAFLLASTSLVWAGYDEWTLDPSPYHGGGNNNLFGVAAIDSDTVSAVGSYEETGIGLYYLLILRRVPDQTPQWAIVQTPATEAYSELFAATAAQDDSEDASTWQMWAVGYQDGTNRYRLPNDEWTADYATTLIERSTDDGQSWHIVESTNPGTGPSATTNILKGVAGTSTDDVWAVGYYFNAAGGIYQQTLIQHWNGSQWSTITSPNVSGVRNYLTSVSAISTSDVWAVGYTLNSSNQSAVLLLHWNGTEWGIVTNPTVSGSYSYLYGVTCADADNCWAVGTYNPAEDTTDETLVLRKGTFSNWTVESSPSPSTSLNRLYGAANVSEEYVWAVGKYQSTPSNTLTMRRLPTTGWETVSSPNADTDENVLRAVVVVPGTTVSSGGDVWAVGYYKSSTLLEELTLIMQYTIPGSCCSP